MAALGVPGVLADPRLSFYAGAALTGSNIEAALDRALSDKATDNDWRLLAGYSWGDADNLKIDLTSDPALAQDDIRRLLADPMFFKVLGTTLMYLVGVVPPVEPPDAWPPPWPDLRKREDTTMRALRHTLIPAARFIADATSARGTTIESSTTDRSSGHMVGRTDLPPAPSTNDACHPSKRDASPRLSDNDIGAAVSGSAA